MKWQKCNSVLKLKQNSLCGDAGYAIGKLCAGQGTKNCVGGSRLGRCCDQSQTSREWEMNRAPLSFSYAIHYVNESLRSRWCFFGMLWYTQMVILVHIDVDPGSLWWTLCPQILGCCLVHVIKGCKWMFKLELLIGGTDWSKIRVLVSRRHNLSTND